MRGEHPVLSVTQHEYGYIERRKGSWCYYQAHRTDGAVCNFARKRDAVSFLDRLARR